ncbi:hypothetical protein P4S63_01885 [Pseudoalteromonas sp. B193]
MCVWGRARGGGVAVGAVYTGGGGGGGGGGARGFPWLPPPHGGYIYIYI